jgi:hypothetical protein
VAACLLVAPGWLYGCFKAAELGPLPTTPPARSELLSRQVVGYDAIEMLNQTIGSTYTVYGLFGERLRYYADGRFLGDHFGPNRFSQVNGQLRCPRSLHESLSLLDADFLLVLHKGDLVTFTDHPDFGRHFAVLASTPDYLLVQLVR